MSLKKLSIYIDLAFCLIVLPTIITLVPVERWLEEYTLFALVLIVFLYVIYFIIRNVNFTRLVSQKKYVHIAVLVILVAGMAFLVSRIPYPTESDLISERLRARLRIQTVWFLFLVVGGFSLSINLMLELFHQILKKKEIEMQKNRMELAMYKSQIRPHFMFNTLNTLYGLLVSKSDKAEEAFAKFASMMQYMYLHAKDDYIRLDDEIEYIRHYVDIQSLRLNVHTKVVWTCEVDNGEMLIPPMIFISFIENAFKYGSSPTKDCKIEISIVQKNENLLFKVSNDVMRSRKKEDASSGIGIKNCRSRLDLLYPGKYSLQTDEEDGKFNVVLTISMTRKTENNMI